MNRKHKAPLLDLLPNSNSTSMASRFLARECAFALLLFSLCGSRSSAIFWAFCAEANENEADSLLQTNMQFNVHLWKPLALLDCVYSEVAFVSLFVDAHQTKKPLESKFQITSRAQNGAPHMNISSIVVNSSQECPSLLLSTMSSILLALETAYAHRNIKVSALFSLATLERLAKKNSEKGLQRIFDFVIQSDSFITVEVLADKGDDHVQHAIEKAVVACSLLPADVRVVLYLKSFRPDHNGVSMLKLMETMSISMESNPLAKGRILMFFVQVPAFQTFHRVLISEVNKKISSTKVFIHDNYPITVPSTIPNPTPTIITVPSTNPVSVLPTSPSTIPMTAPITVPSTNPMPIPITNPANPTNAPITIPSTNPMSNPVTNPSNPTYTPITVPSTDPSTNPSTNPTLAPSIPVTNPVTTPVTEPTNQPVTNPVTTSPFSQPSVTPPVTNPGTIPVPPTGLGQTWCVAKSGLPDSALQLALDYACGIGGADCSAIQVTGSCYNPNTLQAHASYAFNSYYQRNPIPSSCDFGGTAMVVTVNPSTAACLYPSSSSAFGYNNPATGLNPSSGLNPASGFSPDSTTGMGSGFSPGSATGSGFTPGSSTGSGSGSSVLNNNSAGGSSSSTVLGSDNPSGNVRNGSISRLVWWMLPIFLLTSAGNIW